MSFNVLVCGYHLSNFIFVLRSEWTIWDIDHIPVLPIIRDSDLKFLLIPSFCVSDSDSSNNLFLHIKFMISCITFQFLIVRSISRYHFLYYSKLSSAQIKLFKLKFENISWITKYSNDVKRLAFVYTHCTWI